MRGDPSQTIRTPERKAWMRENYATSTLHIQGIIDALNTLPGKPLTDPGQVHNLAVRMGLKRQHLIQTVPPPDVWTEARQQYLREHWLDPVPMTVLLEQVNAIPAPKPVSTTQALQDARKRLGLPSRLDVGRAVLKARNQQRRAEKAAKPKAPKPPRQVALRPMPAPVEDAGPLPAWLQRPEYADEAVERRLDKARGMLKAKRDPFEVHLRAGLPLREVFRLRAEVQGRLGHG